MNKITKLLIVFGLCILISFLYLLKRSYEINFKNKIFYDPILEFFKPLSEIMNNNRNLDKAFTLLDSLSIDFCFLYLGYTFFIKEGKHMLILIEMFLYFFFRTFIYVF